MSSTPVRAVPGAPPRWAVRFVLWLRTVLLGLVRRMVPPPVALFELVTDLIRVPMCCAACHLELPDLLAERPRTADELAAAIGADPVSLARLLRTMVSCGLLDRGPDGRFRNNRMTEAMRRNVPNSMRDALLFAGTTWHARSWAAFPEAVRTGRNAFESVEGKPLFDWLADRPEEQRLFGAGMASLTGLDAPTVARGYDFSGVRRLCDVGGGTGTVLAVVLAQHRKLEGLLYDHPDVVSRSGPVLASWGVEPRCSTQGGDFFSSVPAGCDAYFMRDVLHDWDDARARKILASIRSAAQVGARLLVNEMVLPDDDSFFPGKLLDLEMMTVTPEGRQRTRSEMTALLASEGFRVARVIDLASPYSIVEAFAV